MAANRLEALKSLASQDPGNSFLRYGLAMEYATAGHLEPAAAEFQSLLAASPDYVAAYYHGGQTLARLGRDDEARALYRRGIEACNRTGDGHTRSEIEAALVLL
ncbi:MAG: tetratricopeptide repeat protein, partial [Bryobacteraceae bacterium]